MLSLQAVERTWPAGAVHDSVRAVLRDPAFNRSLRTSLFDRLLLQILHWLESLRLLLRGLPSTRSLALGIVALLVLFVALRVVLSARARDSQREVGRHRRAASSTDDPWLDADRCIEAGRYEDAAHALYRGVVLTLSRQERLRLDPARTSGDYARELRRRGAASLAPFRAFTRRFDMVVYGHGRAEAQSLAELRALAEPFRTRARAA